MTDNAQRANGGIAAGVVAVGGFAYWISTRGSSAKTSSKGALGTKDDSGIQDRLSKGMNGRTGSSGSVEAVKADR